MDVAVNTKSSLPIGEAAQRLGLSVDTVRRLEREGKLKAERTKGGHRRFRPEVIEAFRRMQGALTRPVTRRGPAHKSQRSRKPASSPRLERVSTPLREPDDDLPECFDDLEELGGVEDHEEDEELLPLEPRPSAQRMEPVQRNPIETPMARTEVPRLQNSDNTQEDAVRFDNLKRHGLTCIPRDVPPVWRAKVIEDLDRYVTSEWFPSWVPDHEAYQVVRGRVEQVLKPYHDEIAEAAAQQEAEEQARRRVQALIDHGMSYARRETKSGWDYAPRIEARQEVEEALKAEVKSDWVERDVRELVDEILGNWDDDEDVDNYEED